MVQGTFVITAHSDHLARICHSAAGLGGMSIIYICFTLTSVFRSLSFQVCYAVVFEFQILGWLYS